MSTTIEAPLDIQVKCGPTFTSRWGQWHRHDFVTVDGKELKGSIQVRRRYLGRRFGHRIETTTGFDRCCVMGRAIDWLIRMNKETV